MTATAIATTDEDRQAILDAANAYWQAMTARHRAGWVTAAEHAFAEILDMLEVIREDLVRVRFGRTGTTPDDWVVTWPLVLGRDPEAGWLVVWPGVLELGEPIAQICWDGTAHAPIVRWGDSPAAPS